MALPQLLSVVSLIGEFLDAPEFCDSANCCKGVQIPQVRDIVEKKRTIFYRSEIKRLQRGGVELLWSWQRRVRVACTECGAVDQWTAMCERGTTGLYKCSTCDWLRQIRNPFRRGGLVYH